MSFWNFTRSAASARLAIEFGQEYGLAAAALLAGTRLSFEQLSDPNVELSANQELAVIRNLLRQLKYMPGLGLKLGMRYHFSAYGIWGYGLISSATLGDALALALRFMPLTYAYTRITFHEEGELGIITFGEPDLPIEMRRFLVERDMAAATVLLQETAGSDFALSRLTLAAPTTHAHIISRIGGVRPEFGAAANMLAFKLSWLSKPLPQADASTLTMCQQMCRQLLERRRTRMGTAMLVREYLGVARGGMEQNLAQLARLLNTSERTLKRRLKEEGTSFRILLAAARGDMAQELLQDASLTLTDIADQLGFSDLSSFSQAFKRWYGIAPSQFRGRPS